MLSVRFGHRPCLFIVKPQKGDLPMKKIICLLLCLILSVMMIPGAAAESADAEYPAVRINPATGKAWDLGGKTVYLYDWWSGAWDDPDWERNNEQQATYDYRKWIEKPITAKS